MVYQIIREILKLYQLFRNNTSLILILIREYLNKKITYNYPIFKYNNTALDLDFHFYRCRD